MKKLNLQINKAVIILVIVSLLIQVLSSVSAVVYGDADEGFICYHFSATTVSVIDMVCEDLSFRDVREICHSSEITPIYENGSIVNAENWSSEVCELEFNLENYKFLSDAKGLIRYLSDNKIKNVSEEDIIIFKEFIIGHGFLICVQSDNDKYFIPVICGSDTYGGFENKKIYNSEEFDKMCTAEYKYFAYGEEKKDAVKPIMNYGYKMLPIESMLNDLGVSTSWSDNCNKMRFDKFYAFFDETDKTCYVNDIYENNISCGDYDIIDDIVYVSEPMLYMPFVIMNVYLYTDYNKHIFSLEPIVVNDSDYIKVYLNHREMDLKNIPIIDNENILLPMREIFEKLAAEVSWENDTNTATAVRNDISISVTIDNNTMLKNGNLISLETEIRLINDKTYVPLEVISEFAEETFIWDKHTDIVFLFD